MIQCTSLRIIALTLMLSAGTAQAEDIRVICLGDRRGGLPMDRMGRALTPNAPHAWTAADFRKENMTLPQAEKALEANQNGMKDRWQNGDWNALLLQPSGRMTAGDTVAVCKRLIDRFVKDYPEGQIFIYGAWPDIDTSLLSLANIPHPLELPENMELYRKAFAFERQWLAQADPDPKASAGISRAGQYAVFEALQNQYPRLWKSNRLRSIPVGDVFYEISKHMAGGWVPGVDNINQCYADSETLKKGLPQYLADMALYAAVFGGEGAYVHEPAALDIEFYKRAASKSGLPLTREQADVIERWVWRHMTQHRLINNKRGQLPDGVPTRAWPSVAIQPMLDVPMRDAAISRAPDGTYYLTGTLGKPCTVSSVE